MSYCESTILHSLKNFISKVELVDFAAFESRANAESCLIQRICHSIVLQCQVIDCQACGHTILPNLVKFKHMPLSTLNDSFVFFL